MDCLNKVIEIFTKKIFKQKKRYAFLLFIFFSANFFSFAQCPTISNINPSFCDIESPTIASLQATDNGGGVAWFATALSTTPLPSNIGLINGQTYFLDNSTGNCGNRIPVTVSVYSAPIGQNFQGVCVSSANDATLASLNATGNNVQWYSAAFGGNALPLTTVLNSGTIYYAGQSNPITDCLTSRLPVFVVVNVVAVPSGESTQVFCHDTENPPTVNDLIASGTNNWYLTNSSALVLAPNTPLVDGQIYYGTTVSPPCESAQRIEILVQLLPENQPGESANLIVCETDLANAPNINLFDNLGGIPSNMGVWTGSIPLSNGNLGTLNYSDLTLSGSPYIFTYTVDNSPVCPPESATITITIIENVNAGTDGTATFCESDSPTDLFTFLGVDADLGGTWTPALASGTGIFNPLIDLGGIYVYTVTGTQSCPSDMATVTVNVVEDVNAGTSATATLCQSDSPIDLFTLLGDNPDLGGTWSPSLASGTGIFDPAIDTTGIYTYTVEGILSCPSDSATLAVEVIPNLNAGINGVANFCESDLPTDLFAFLGGNPDLGGTWTPALASGTGVFNPAVDIAGIYTYTVQGNLSCPADSATITVSIFQSLNPGISGVATFCETDSPLDLFTFLTGNPDSGGTWSPSLASGTGVFDPSVDLSGIYTYTLAGSASCPSVFSTVNVTVIESLSAGTDGNAAFCENESSADLFAFLNGNPDVGGTWSPSLASGTGDFNPSLDLPGVYTYTHAAVGFCTADSATVTVIVDDFLEAGENGTYTICESELTVVNTINLFNELEGVPSNTGVWSGPLGTTNGNLGALDISTLTAVQSPYVFTYTVTNSNSCPISEATVTVVVEPIQNAGTNNSVVFCKNEMPQNLFSFLGGNPTAGGIWSPALTSVSGVFNPSVDVAGVYTYTLPASSCPSDSATITVSITESVNSGISGTVTFCENDVPTDLFSILGGNPTVGGTWSPALSSGSGIFNPAVDIAGVYTYSVSGTFPCPSANTTVNVLIDVLPSNTLANINFGTICLNSSTSITITNATNLANGTYQLTYEISGEIVFNNTISVTFQNGNTTFVIPATVFTAIGTSVLTISPIQSNVGNNCGISGNLFNPVTFTIEEVKTPTYNGTNTFCELENATISNLTSNVIETDTIVWYNAPLNGNAYAATDVLLDGTTYYASIVNASGCESVSRLAVTVSIDECKETKLIIPDGFSPNGDGINDFFEIKNITTLYPNFTIQIFNRWGNLVFEGNANNPNWDGNNKKGMKIGGEHAPTGVYFFIISFNDGIKKDLQGRLYLSK